MRSKVLRSGLGVLGVAALLALSFVGYSRFAGRNRLRFTYLTGQLAPSAYGALASQPGWSAAKLEVAPRVSLRGLVRRPRSKTAPWVLFYPGNDAAQLGNGQTVLTRLAEHRDWGLGVFSYRGYESSDGTPRLADLALDAATIRQQLCVSEGIAHERLHVVGFSIGGHLATHAVAAAARQHAPAASLSLLASVDDIVMLRRSPWQRLSSGDDYQTRPLLANVPAPVLVLQGGADETLGGPLQGRAIGNALGPRARYHELPGVGHEGLLQNEQAFLEIRAFISQHSQ